MTSVLSLVFLVLSTISYAGDLGFRLKEGACVDPQGQQGFNPDFVGECGFLEGAQLAGSDLRGKNLRGANLAGANLKVCKCGGADFSWATLSNADLEEADFGYAKFSHAKMESVKAQKAVFSYAEMDFIAGYGADFRYSTFEQTSLSRAQLTNGNLFHAVLDNASLSESNFTSAHLISVLIRNSNLTKMKFENANLRSARFENCNLFQANFSNAKLLAANFTAPEHIDQAAFHRALYNTQTRIPLSESSIASFEMVKQYFQPAPLNEVAPMVMPDGETVVTYFAGHIFWLKSGNVAADYPYEIIVTSPFQVLPDNETILVGHYSGLKWLRQGIETASYRVNGFGPITHRPTILSDGETVVALSGSSVLWLKKGEELAKWEIGASPFVGPALLLGDGETVVVAKQDGNVYWLNKGTVVSTYTSSEYAYRSPLVLADGETIVCMGPESMSWLRRGKLLRTTEGIDVIGRPVLLGDGETILAVSTRRKIVWVRSGGTAAAIDFPHQITVAPLVLSDGETILVKNWDATSWLKEGAELQKVLADGSQPFASVVLGDQKSIVTLYPKGRVTWLNAAHKNEHEFKLDGESFLPPIVLGDGKTVFIQTKFNGLFWLKEGQKIAEFHRPGYGGG